MKKQTTKGLKENIKTLSADLNLLQNKYNALEENIDTFKIALNNLIGLNTEETTEDKIRDIAREEVDDAVSNLSIN